MIVVDDKTHNDITEKPVHGCYVHGMFLEGAKWDDKKHILGDCIPKELFSNLPMMLLKPTSDR